MFRSQSYAVSNFQVSHKANLKNVVQFHDTLFLNLQLVCSYMISSFKVCNWWQLHDKLCKSSFGSGDLYLVNMLIYICDAFSFSHYLPFHVPTSLNLFHSLTNMLISHFLALHSPVYMFISWQSLFFSHFFIVFVTFTSFCLLSFCQLHYIPLLLHFIIIICSFLSQCCLFFPVTCLFYLAMFVFTFNVTCLLTVVIYCSGFHCTDTEACQFHRGSDECVNK